ncbi:thioredoxin family protein [Phaeovibrio sulfidiphilus]|uniref:Thioredoxin family protein n=1 Tax=Phaeovibrio sulfidiphilus TaxID=1220600 RepID=A0A8J6YN71_9PROT|nr:thioredoxin family protein [Phaeovibrio sulfidiphilus]
MLILLAGLLVSLPATGLAAADSDSASAWSDSPEARVRLTAATRTLGAQTDSLLGVEFDLKPGWNIYWRDPGDAGLPPEFDWSGSKNLADARVLWPVPRRFSFAGMETAGYEGHVILPVVATIPDPAKALDLSLALDYLTCNDIQCVPRNARLHLVIPPGRKGSTAPEPSAQAQSLARAMALVPGTGSSHGLTITEAVIEPGGVVRIRVRSATPLSAPDLFLDSPAALTFEPPSILVNADATEAVIRARRYGDLTLEDVTLDALVTDGPRGVETPVHTDTEAIPVDAAPPDFHALGRAGAPAASQPERTGGLLGLLLIAGTALLGGFILNLMPCVLPVLSLKILGVLTHAGQDRTAARRSFLATSAGIVFSFLLLAVLAIGLKAAGAAAGWGIQFQHPIFLAGMALVLTLFTANLWGLFEIPVPALAGRLGAGAGAGKGRSPLAGAFATGAFATLMATPCSAPFLGTAIGFALSSGPGQTLVIFGLLGVGMALPYLLLGLKPSMTGFLPKPGPWMLWLRAVLGVALFATTAWLLFVLNALVGLGWTVTLGSFLVSVLLCLWAFRDSHPLVRLSTVVCAFLLVYGIAQTGRSLLGWGFAPPGQDTRAKTTEWRPFSDNALKTLLAQGEVVLVDVTADWCVTCQVNKAAVLERGAVETAINTRRIRALRADWTKPDPAISEYLARFGRYGIPFNAVYGPGAPQGIPLPELLTEKNVMDAIDRAESGGRP